MLVSNVEQSSSGGSGLDSFDQAQGFTTGSNSEGYTLDSVEVRFFAAGSDVTVRIATGLPSSTTDEVTLTGTSSPGTEEIKYSAPDNTTLSASTTYYVVVEGTSGTVSTTTSDSEDSDGKSGWSLADSGHFRSRTSTGSWTSTNSARMIKVNGTEIMSSTGPTITISGDSAVTEGTAAEFTVTASEAPSADLTVNLTVSESAGSDYVAASNEGSKTVTIPASSTTATYSVATEADTVNEPNGTVTVAVAAGTGYSVGTADSADVTVNDDDRAAISGAAITSSPAFGDTYRRRENVEVTVTWDEDVTWNLSTANARMRVRLDIGGTTRAADLVTGGVTSGTARSLAFRYAVVNGDTDGNGLAVTTTVGGDLVILNSGATLQGADGRPARRKHAGLAADADHKVDGSVVTKAPGAPDAPTVSSASSTSLSVSWSAPSNLGTASSITDYDLRYFQGTTAPSNNADWIREGEANGPPDPGSNTSATITGLTTGAPYLVQVRAFGDLESPWSASTSGTPMPEAPGAPDAPTVSAASKTSLSVSWSAPDDLGSASSITDYDLRYFAGTSDPTNEANWIEEGETNGPPDPGSNTSAKITGLTAGTAYRVQVRAFGDLESPWSTSTSGTPENQAPVFTATDGNPADQDINAPGGTLVSMKADRTGFSDPDGDTLTISVTMSREDTHTGFTDNSGHNNPLFRRIAMTSKGACELANLDPALSAPPAPETTVTLTAADPSGLTAQLTRRFVLSSYAGPQGNSGVHCPTLTGAAVTADTLTLTYEGANNQMPSNLQGSEFTVKVAGTAVNLAATNPVTIGASAITGDRASTPVTLKLDAAVTHGQTVTVSHAPGATPSTVGFADETATNNTPEPDATPPALDSATVTDGRTVTLTFDEDLATPGGQELRELRWAFSADGLYNDGVRLRNVVPSQVAVSGPTVTLTFGSLEALPGRDVSVRYRASIAEELGVSLQDGSGNKAAAFTRTLTRTVTGPIPPVLSAAQVAGTALTMTFDAALDASSTPAGSRFRVTHRARDWHGETVFVSGTGTASVSGSAVTVTLAEAVPQDSFVQVAYSKGDDANPLRGDSSGPKVADIWWSHAVSVLDRTPPKLVSGSVAGTRVTLYYGEALDTGSTPATGDFTVTAAGTAQTVSGVAMTKSAVKLTLGASVAANAAVAVTYTAGSNPVRDIAGNDAANFSGETVTNRGPTDPGKPALAAAAPPSMAGAVLTLTFDRDLDPANVPAASAFTISDSDDTDEWGRSVTGVAVRGRTVELVVSPGWYPCSEPLTVTYGKPASNALRNVWGTQADGFSGQAVMNARASECIYNWMAQARMGSVILTARRPFAQDAEPDTAWFSVAASGGPVTVTGAAYSPDEPHELKLTLSRDIAPDETATVSYRRPRGNAGLWDVDGRQLADIGPATVARVTQDAPADADSVRAGAVSLGAQSPDRGRQFFRGKSLDRANGDAVDYYSFTTDGRYRLGLGVRGQSVELKMVLEDADGEVVGIAGPPSDPTKEQVYNEWLNRVIEPGTYYVRVEALEDGATDYFLRFGLKAPPPAVPPLTAAFVGMPAGHAGKGQFTFELRFSEDFPGRLRYKLLRDEAFEVTNGRVRVAKRVAKGQNQRWNISVKPDSYEDVVVRLPAATDCAASGAVCTEAGRKLSNTVVATVRGPVLLSVADARAREGVDPAVLFPVSLSRAAPGVVTVKYLTRDGTATAGEDYTAQSGTLTFAPGDTEKTIEVPILDDVLDEGSETFILRLTNPDGARIGDGEATGTIENSDPLQTMWLSRFGRTVADHVAGAVSDRLSNPMTGMQVTVGGQGLDLAQMEDEAWLDRTMVSMARVLGVPDRSGPGDEGWPDTGLGMHESPTFGSAPVRSVTGREVLLGSSFHLAGDSGDGGGADSGMTAWGRVTTGGFDGEATADGGNVRIDGEVTTGILGTDAKWGRVLAGIALSVSEGEGTFDQPGVDSGEIESTMTTGSPYARMELNDRVSAWGMAGFGTGDMTIVQQANTATNQPERITRSDLSLRMAAVGGRGALMTSGQTGGMDLALKADAFLVQTESEAVSGEGNTKADASRVRLILEGSRAFKTANGVLTPGLELGLRRDGGDAEKGTGVELGGRISYANPETGLSLEANVRALVAHEDSGYEEWGASGALSLVPGERGRGLSFRLAPTYGTPGSGVERLWSARDAGGLASGGDTFDPESRIEGEIGYGLPAFGDRFTGTPNVGFTLADGGAREYRLGWRLARAGGTSSGSFALSLDAARSERAGNNDSGSGTSPKHAVVLRAGVRW